MGDRFHGRIALVTGGGKGIGRATAKAFATDGAAVAVVDIDQAAAETVAGTINDQGGTPCPWWPTSPTRTRSAAG